MIHTDAVPTAYACAPHTGVYQCEFPKSFGLSCGCGSSLHASLSLGHESHKTSLKEWKTEKWNHPPGFLKPIAARRVLRQAIG